eukprot:scaffold10594_cov60-Phaeocystis_antarctica.AAC.2
MARASQESLPHGAPRARASACPERTMRPQVTCAHAVALAVDACCCRALRRSVPWSGRGRGPPAVARDRAFALLEVDE